MSETRPEEVPIARGPNRGLTIAILALIVAGFGVAIYYDRVMPSPRKAAPNVSFFDKEGNPSTLADYRGKIVLLNFWASWCPPCLEEMPALERLGRALSDDPDFVILGASQDDTWEELEGAAERFGVTFPVAHDPQGKAARAFGTEKLPETYLIDREGRIIYRWISVQAWGSDGFVRRMRKELAAGQAEPQS